MSYPPPPGQQPGPQPGQPYPPQPPQAYPQQYPGAQPPGGKPRLRGRTPLRLALIFGVLGIVLAVVGGVIGFKAGLSKVNDFKRVSVAQGTAVLSLNAGNYVAYYEAPGYNTNSNSVPVIQFGMRNATTGQIVHYVPYGNRSDGKVSSLTYDYNGHHGAALWQFTISTSGRYQVQLARGSLAAANSDLAFGSSIATGLAAGGITAIVGVLLIIVAVILLIVGLVKRNKHKSELARASYGAPAGYGYPPPQAPQQSGYPPAQQGSWTPPSS